MLIEYKLKMHWEFYSRNNANEKFNMENFQSVRTYGGNKIV